jgi:hypothetical protein
MNGEISKDSGTFPPLAVRIRLTLQSSQVYSADWLTFAHDRMGAAWPSKQCTFTPENFGASQLLSTLSGVLSNFHTGRESQLSYGKHLE